jgi:two-component system response regulator VanR
MHWAYAWAFARGVVAPDEDPPVWAAVVVGPAPALGTVGTVGDLDPPEQAATATHSTTAAAGHRFDERNLRAGSLEVMPPIKAAAVLPARMWFSICRRYVPAGIIESMRVLIVEDEPFMAEAIRDGLRLEAIAADIAGDGDTALELLSVNAYDIAVLDRDIPGPSGDEIAERIVASGSGMPILMLTAADRLDDKATGFGLGADDYLTKPFELQELVLRLRALDRRRAHNRPPVREIAGLRLDPFRREVYRDGRYIALTRKQFAVLEVLVAAEGGVVSAEELLERAWDENADPFTNAVRITVSALRKRLGEPWIIATVAGVGYRIDTQPDTGREGRDRG